MNDNKYGFVGEIVVITFMLGILFILLIFLILGDKDNEEIYRNIEQNKIGTYMTSVFFERDTYKVGKLNIPGLGLEPNIEYNAVCYKVTEECWKVIAFIVKGDILYGYREGNFFVFSQNNVGSYSLYDLNNLSEAEQEILLDLRKNPRFIFE